MDIRALNTFIEAAELGSFSKAAEKLGYSQPTVSFQIKQLEQELGIRLFDRIARNVSLTEEGRQALHHAQNICRMSEEMCAASRSSHEPEGLVRLAMADSLCTPLVLGCFRKLRELYPKIQLHITTAGTAELFRLLDQNEADIVCTLDRHIYSASYRIFSEEKLQAHFVCAAGDELADREGLQVKELLHRPFLLTEKGMSYRRILDEWLAKSSLEIQPVLEIGRAELIAELVSQGMGLGFLPDYVTEEFVAAGRLKRLHTEDFSMELWKQLIYHREKWLSLPMKTVIEYLSAVLINDQR